MATNARIICINSSPDYQILPAAGNIGDITKRTDYIIKTSQSNKYSFDATRRSNDTDYTFGVDL